LPASVQELAVKVTPPAYTGMKVYTTEDLNLSVPEGSLVSWNIIFSDTVADAGLVFLQGDSLNLSPTGPKEFFQNQTSINCHGRLHTENRGFQIIIKQRSSAINRPGLWFRNNLNTPRSA
jgi:hypothetical protein